MEEAREFQPSSSAGDFISVFTSLYIGADYTGELLSAPFYFLFFIPFPSVSLYPCLPLSLHSTVSIHVHASSIQLKVADKEGAKARTGIKNWDLPVSTFPNPKQITLTAPFN